MVQVLVVPTKRLSTFIVTVTNFTFISGCNQILYTNFFHRVTPNPWQQSQILHFGFTDRGVAIRHNPAFFLHPANSAINDSAVIQPNGSNALCL